MRLLSAASAAAIALVVGSTPVSASVIDFVGSTTGCFGTPCTAQTTASDHTLRFTGTNHFETTLTPPGTSSPFTLGSFRLTNTGPFNPYAFLGDSFDLRVQFTSPVSTTTDVFASVTGLITVLGGLVYIDFSPKTVTYGQGSFVLSVNDVLLGTTLFSGPDIDPLTGTITMSAAVPEPSTWAMMLLGFAGLGFLSYRRKQIGRAIAGA